jgi:hypothetical protein
MKLCPSGKMPYASHSEASRARKGLKRRSNAAPRDLSPYQCSDCEQWHLGRATKPRDGKPKRHLLPVDHFPLA